MSQTILYFIFILFASFFLLKITNSILQYYNFYSQPTDRGLHKHPITTSGGIFFIFYIILLFFILDEKILGLNIDVLFLLLLTTIIFGTFDDKKNLSRKHKLFAQIILSLMLLFLFNFELFQNLFPIIEINYIYYLLNILFIIGFINFINFIDGSDGNLTLFVFFIFVCLISKLQINFLIKQYFYLIYFLPFLISFYFFNIRKKIFLGESGSFFLSVFLILNLSYFVSKNIIFISDLLIISSYFITDMIITFFLRIYHYGFNSFKAHRDHAYQYFCYLKKDHKKLSLYMAVYNFAYIFPLYLMNLKGYIYPLPTLLFCFVPSIFFVIRYSPLVKKNHER
jgi:UDP-N-acetylmuramyl pentapeptide phosphotransferase/UDP-N-acetylglucosamine-1-phosphate transferase